MQRRGRPAAGCVAGRACRGASLLPRRAAAQDEQSRAGEKAHHDGKGVAEGAPVAKSAEGTEEEPFFEEVSGDDPLVLDLEERLRKQMGNKDLTLDMVLNPGTIVNTEREVVLLRAQLKATSEEDAAAREELEKKIEEKQMKIVNEMRLVMTDSLKLEFLLQGILSIPLFGALSYDAFPSYPDLEWLGLPAEYNRLAFRLFGIWGIWLLTVPALRARKPGGPFGMGYEEKRALDISFLILPFVCFCTPFVSKDPAVTFWGSVFVLVACYAWSFNADVEGELAGSRRGAGKELNLPEPMMWALRALDFGTGSERGARSEDTTWQNQLEAYELEAEKLLAAKKAEAEAKQPVEKRP